MFEYKTVTAKRGLLKKIPGKVHFYYKLGQIPRFQFKVLLGDELRSQPYHLLICSTNNICIKTGTGKSLVCVYNTCADGTADMLKNLYCNMCIPPIQQYRMTRA